MNNNELLQKVNPQRLRKNISGRKFGKLTIVRPLYKFRGKIYWECVCECGSITSINGYNILSGGSTACRKCRNVKHGSATKSSRRSEYNIWFQMKSRCLNSNNKNYHHYGGRGVTVCDRWRMSYEAFLQDMGPKPDKDYTIDRIDNDLGYCKENCRWVHKSLQNSNKRNNRRVLDLSTGKVYDTVSEASQHVGYSKSYLYEMITGRKTNKTNLVLYEK